MFDTPGKAEGAVDADRDAVQTSSSSEEQDQVLQWLQHGSPLDKQVVSKEMAADTAGSRQQQQQAPCKRELIQKPAWASQQGFAGESKLQRLASGRCLADGDAGQSPNPHVQSHHGLQHRLSALVDSDSNTDDDNHMVDHSNTAGGKRRCTSQLLGKEIVTKFMARLHKPRSMSLQHQHMPQGPSQQDQRPMQQQQPQLRQHRPAKRAQQTGSKPMCNLSENTAEDDASTSSQYSDNAEVPATWGPQAHFMAHKQPLHLTTKEHCSDGVGVGMSPVQMAVSAVVGRLKSVQQGLASAEDRLAVLTGREPATERQARLYHHVANLHAMSKHTLQGKDCKASKGTRSAIKR